jgi:hypothetical protein
MHKFTSRNEAEGTMYLARYVADIQQCNEVVASGHFSFPQTLQTLMHRFSSL